MLNGCHLRVVAAKYPPDVSYIEDNCMNNTCFRGMFADIWDEMSRDMNFSYSVRRVEEWGSYVNGTWNGMVRMLQKNQVDIAVSGLAITKDRSDVIKFLPSMLTVEEKLFINTPEDSLNLYAYGDPFATYSWIGVIALILIMPIILATILFINKRIYSEQYELSHCYWYVIETLMANISMRMPHGNSSRVSFLTLLLAGLIIHFYWEATLISYLVVRKPVLPFSTLDELAEQSHYRILIAKGTVHIDRFRHSTKPSHIKIWKDQIEPYLDALPYASGLVSALLQDPKLVMYSEDGSKHHARYRQCRFIDAEVPIYTSQLAWAVPKKSKLYPMLSRRIIRLKETGIMQRYFKRYKPQIQKCPDDNGKAIKIKQCVTPFLILLVGTVGSTLMFILELSVPFRWIHRCLNLGMCRFKTIKSLKDKPK